jgi:succinate dehydrogenase / fumarate reductase cytochrome b subunit
MTSNPDHRPLSPHLQIYKPQITSILSITHRITGIGLTVGIFFFLYWLDAIATGPETYANALCVFKSQIGQVILNLCLLAFYYHTANGIRHLAWDMGYGFSLKAVKFSGWAVIIIALFLTFFTGMTIK